MPEEPSVRLSCQVVIAAENVVNDCLLPDLMPADTRARGAQGLRKLAAVVLARSFAS